MNFCTIPLFFLICAFGHVRCVENPRVIIIGAGPSGIAAATRLLENNITNIVILEAENRIGGRINSVKFGDAYIDLGAHWCHGEEDNIVYNMVKDLDVLESTISKPIIYYSSMNRLNWEFNEQLNDAIGAAFEVRTKNVRDSVKNFYTAKFTDVVVSRFATQTEKLRLSLAANRLLEQLILAHRGAFSLSTVIVERDYKICGGDLRLNWNGAGYKRILDVMMRKYPNPSKALPLDEKLKLNKEVKNIQWNNSLQVTTSDGEHFSGDYVIFTPSVGVLKHDHEKLFTPSLPTIKQDAIMEIGLDAIVDISLHFPQKWWSDEDEEYYFVWEEDVIINELENILKHGKWVLDLFNVTPNPNNPNVLTIWIVGPSVPNVELLSDDAVVGGILYVFKHFFTNFNVTIPDYLVRSNWYSNPHFRGTYSYQTQKAFERRPSAEVVLSQPLTNHQGETVLLFAGEATHPYYYSTVHGAIETGYREADRIIQLSR